MSNLGRIVLMTVGLVCSTNFAFAHEGSKGGGGGDTRGSTTAQVVAAIHNVIDEPANYSNAPNNIYVAFFNMQYLPAVRNLRDRDLQHMFAGMVSQTNPYTFASSAVYTDLKTTRFDIRLAENCPADGKRKETHGYTEHRLGAAICLGVPLLRQIPVNALEFQIRGLVAHELAHHFGYDEEDANRFQNVFVSQNVGTVDENLPLEELEATFLTLQNKVRDILSSVSTGDSKNDGQTCLEIGEANGLANHLQDKVWAGIRENRRNASEPTDFSAITPASWALVEKATQLKSFCTHLPVDTQQLGTYLDALNTATRAFGKANGFPVWE